MVDDTQGVGRGGMRPFGKVLTTAGILIGAISALGYGAGVLILATIQSSEAPNASLADDLGMLSAPFMLTGLPLAAAGAAILIGRLLTGARPSRGLALAGLAVGGVVTAALVYLVANGLHGHEADAAWSADLSASDAPLWVVAIGAGLALAGLSLSELVRPRRLRP